MLKLLRFKKVMQIFEVPGQREWTLVILLHERMFNCLLQLIPLILHKIQSESA